MRLAHIKAESIPLLLAVACEKFTHIIQARKLHPFLNPAKGVGVGNAAVANQLGGASSRLAKPNFPAAHRPPSAALLPPDHHLTNWRSLQKRLPLPAATKSLTLPHLSTIGFRIIGHSGVSTGFQTTTPALTPSAMSWGRMVSTSPDTGKHPLKRSKARGCPGAWQGLHEMPLLLRKDIRSPRSRPISSSFSKGVSNESQTSRSIHLHAKAIVGVGPCNTSGAFGENQSPSETIPLPSLSLDCPAMRAFTSPGQALSEHGTVCSGISGSGTESSH